MFRSRIIYFLLFCFISPCFLHGQNEEKHNVDNSLNQLPIKDRLVYAGNVGLNFGNVTSISVSPMVGYKVTNKFIPGVGVTYNYLRFHYVNYVSKAINIYGGSIWARYYILENIFLHGEYEALNGEWDPYFRPNYRYYLNSLLVGGGYRESFGKLSSYILVLYNVTYSQDSPYPTPLIIKAGFGFGL